MKIYNNLTYAPFDSDTQTPIKQIGIWGHRHAKYLRDFHPELYFTMLCKTELAEYLETVNTKAEQMYSELSETLGSKDALNKIYDDLILKLPKELEARKYEILL